MRIGYVATDEVNQALAARMAAKCGAIICHLRPGEVHPDGLFDAVLYNLDDVPRDQQPAFLEELCLGTPDCPTAVHGYGIADEQAQALRRHGVAVAQRLHPALPARRRRRATPPPGPAPQPVHGGPVQGGTTESRDRPIRRRPDGLVLGQPGQVTEPRFRPTGCGVTS